MNENPFCGVLQQMQAFFHRSTASLEEEDAGFAPAAGMFTAAQHVAHAAQTIDWFVEGAFRKEGFDLDFAKHDQEVRAVGSLAAARAWFDRAVRDAITKLAALGPEEMGAPIADGPVLGGAPRSAAIAAMTEHTAHHRGALTVYARLRGKTPAMPYG